MRSDIPVHGQSSLGSHVSDDDAAETANPTHAIDGNSNGVAVTRRKARWTKRAKETIAAGGPATTHCMNSLSHVRSKRGIVHRSSARNSLRSCTRSLSPSQCSRTWTSSSTAARHSRQMRRLRSIRGRYREVRRNCSIASGCPDSMRRVSAFWCAGMCTSK